MSTFFIVICGVWVSYFYMNKKDNRPWTEYRDTPEEIWQDREDFLASDKEHRATVPEEIDLNKVVDKKTSYEQYETHTKFKDKGLLRARRKRTKVRLKDIEDE